MKNEGTKVPGEPLIR